LESSETVKKFIRNQTLQRLKVLDEQLRTAAQAPRDAEVIHDLRVAARRFSQCLRVFKKSFAARDVREFRKHLSNLLQHCGAVRNYDIALELLDTVSIQNLPLRRALQSQRRSTDKELAVLLDAFSLAHWRDRLTSPSKVKAPNLEEMINEWFEAGNAAAVKGGEYETMHRFRLLGKRLRYTLELFAEIYDGALDQTLETLRTAQDKLGEINDCVTALPLLKGHPKAEAAVSKLLAQREQAFRTYWPSVPAPEALAPPSAPAS